MCDPGCSQVAAQRIDSLLLGAALKRRAVRQGIGRRTAYARRFGWEALMSPDLTDAVSGYASGFPMPSTILPRFPSSDHRHEARQAPTGPTRYVSHPP